jgi:hypothetical protein
MDASKAREGLHELAEVCRGFMHRYWTLFVLDHLRTGRSVPEKPAQLRESQWVAAVEEAEGLNSAHR